MYQMEPVFTLGTALLSYPNFVIPDECDDTLRYHSYKSSNLLLLHCGRNITLYSTTISRTSLC